MERTDPDAFVTNLGQKSVDYWLMSIPHDAWVLEIGLNDSYENM